MTVCTRTFYSSIIPSDTLTQFALFLNQTVVFVGPVAADRWSIENNARTKSVATWDSLRMCTEESELCASKLSGTGQIPQFVADAINDLSLPCVEKLPWLKAANGKYMTSLHTNSMSGTEKKALLGPYWYRLFRCSDSDVTQLNHFHDTYMRENGMYPYNNGKPMDPTAKGGNYSKSYGYTLAITLADVYSQGGRWNGGWELTLEDVNLLHTKALSIESVDITVPISYV
jgi:hypothetical protein